MKQFGSLLTALLAIGAVQAQTVAVSTLVPATAQVTLNGQTQVTSLAAGPVANSGSLLAWSFAPQGQLAIAEVAWDVISATHGVYCSFSQRGITESANPVSASLSPGDFLLQVSNPTPVAVDLRLVRSDTPPAGAATRILQVDVGNDGVVDFSESSVSTTLTLPLTIGPVPLQVRIHYQLSVPGPASIQMGMQVIVEPVAGIIVTQVTPGCGPGYSQALLPTFAGDLRVQTIVGLHFSGLSVAVFGFSAQPILLPTSQPGPCVLLPTPDVVIFTPVGPLIVPLPPAVRPITFWTQAVVLDPAGLTTTNGARVNAF